MTASLQNPLYVMSAPALKLILRAVEELELVIVFEDIDQAQHVELQNFRCVLEAELQHRGPGTY